MEIEDQSPGASVFRYVPSRFAGNALDNCLPPLPAFGAVDEVGLKPQPIRRPHKTVLADFAHRRLGGVCHVRGCVAAADFEEFGWRWRCGIS